MLTQNVDERREPLYDTLNVVKQTTVKSGTQACSSWGPTRAAWTRRT
jgi:hypothetical protein